MVTLILKNNKSLDVLCSKDKKEKWINVYDNGFLDWSLIRNNKGEYRVHIGDTTPNEFTMQQINWYILELINNFDVYYNQIENQLKD